MTREIPFVDLQAQRRRLGPRIDEAIARVLAHGQFIMGPEVAALEKKLAAFSGAVHAVTCSSGTDALALVLMAKGVKPGQAVICPSLTFCATAEVIAWLGASPVFADVDPQSFNIDPAGVEAAISAARAAGLDPVGITAVDLFGLPADYDGLCAVADAHGLWLLADAAQSFGAEHRGRRVGTLAWATATSFFPAKPLGCYGDGGAILTQDDGLAGLVRSLRIHGQGARKYDSVRIGMAARLDTLQAAILIEKLTIFDDEIRRRNEIATRYSEALAPVCMTPRVPQHAKSVWAQYTIRVDRRLRESLMATLRRDGIPTAIYYPTPLHRQAAFRNYPVAIGGLAATEQLCEEVVSLPMHPYLEAAEQDRVIEAVRRALGA